MKLTLTHDEMNAYCSELHDSNAAFNIHYPADSFHRQPVHTVYGGANLSKAGFSPKLGEAALKPRETHPPTSSAFARALGRPRADPLPPDPTDLPNRTPGLQTNPE